MTFVGSDSSSSSSRDDKNNHHVQSYVPLLHQAIRLGNFHQLPDLIQAACCHADDDTTKALQVLLWEPTSTKWSALHYAVSHGLPLKTFEYMMQLAQKSIITSTTDTTNTSNYFYTRRTQLGQSLLDIFLSTYWNPLPWQTVRYEILCASVDRILENQDEFEHLRQVVSEGRHPSTELLPLLEFLRRLQLLCRVPTARPMTWKAPYDFHHMIRVLAQNGYCPAPVAYLLLSLQQEYRISRDNDDEALSPCPFHSDIDKRPYETTPLHLWAASPSYHSHDGMLLPLLKVYSPLQRDSEQGMYPLQWALQSGKQWTIIYPLWQAAPSVLYTGFAPGWVSTPSKEHIEYATHTKMAGRSGIIVANCFRERNREEVRQQLERERLTLIYCLLMACPQALQHARRLYELRYLT